MADCNPIAYIDDVVKGCKPLSRNWSSFSFLELDGIMCLFLFVCVTLEPGHASSRSQHYIQSS